MKTSIKYVVIAILAMTIVASPFASFAKDNGKGKKDERGKSNSTARVEKQERKISVESSRNDDDNNDDDREDSGNKRKDDSCFKAYGHLIAPGWLKKNGSVNVDIGNCWLPFGIAKKFRGNNSSTTPDVTAPVISNLSFNSAQRQAEVRWNTNENSNSIVFWGTSPSVDVSDTATNRIIKNDYVRSHRVILKNLTATTTYYVVVKSTDGAGNSSVSNVGSFITKAPSADTQAPVISNVVTIIGTSTIQVGWKTNENTTDRVYYSTVLPVILNASTTSFVSNVSLQTNHVLTLSGLTPDTNYYLVIESTDAAGNVTTSATFSARTSNVVAPADTIPPVISSITTTPGASTTTVAWTTNEISTSRVFYSTVNPLDTSASTTASILNSSLLTSHSILVNGLATSTTYYFKVQSVDAAGNTTTSDQFSTTTTSGI